MKKIFFIMIVLIFVSCNNEKPKVEGKSEVIEEKVEIIKELIVEIKFKTNKEDSFKFILNNIIVDDFQSKNIVITEKVSPTSGTDEIITNFGENISNVLIINLGTKELKEIEIETINIRYGENKIKISSSEIKIYFNISKFIQYDSISGKLKTQKVEGKHYPIITLKRNYVNALTQE